MIKSLQRKPQSTATQEGEKKALILNMFYFTCKIYMSYLEQFSIRDISVTIHVINAENELKTEVIALALTELC